MLKKYDLEKNKILLIKRKKCGIYIEVIIQILTIRKIIGDS